ncbi:hypothetical protein TIFTF001_001586 [Ficus carica]|uniref:Uncharacterized protein n=1 Tax=Ficus carica TaxID=3494 RepID=A0AA87ZNV7_FICCA|nr:hypothetical protein TIFTF001_001586 [Ficus carica]
MSQKGISVNLKSKVQFLTFATSAKPTHGGSLRDIPVGRGSSKNTKYASKLQSMLPLSPTTISAAINGVGGPFDGDGKLSSLSLATSAKPAASTGPTAALSGREIPAGGGSRKNTKCFNFFGEHSGTGG